MAETTTPTLTALEKRGVLKSTGYLLKTVGSLKVEDNIYPIDAVGFDTDADMLNLTLRTSDGDSKELLNIDIIASTVKGHNFDIVVTVLQIDLPISFIYKVEKALTTISIHFLERQLVMKPSFRTLKDKIDF